MKSIITNFWRRPLITLVLIFVLSLLLTTAASANSPMEELQWVTICHKAPTMGDSPQTMTIYWSVLDTCLTEFDDYIGACMADPAK
jgi:hypothetical protein